MMGKPKIRFKGYNEDWEQRKLGDIAEVTKLAGFEFTEHVVYSDAGNIIALRGLNIKNGQLILDDVKYIDGSNFSKLNRSKLFIDDIMLTYVGTVGEVAIIKENNRFYLAPNVSRIRVQSNDSPKFISHYMRTDNFKNKVIFPLIATSSQPALSMENIRKFMINMPKNRDEQDCLAEYFDHLDHLITLHQHKCDEMKKLKKYMLQKMFPQNGKKVPEIRFDGFTNDWEQRKLDDWGNFYYGRSCPKWSVAEDATIPCIRYGELYTKFGAKIDKIYSYTNMSPENLRFSNGTEVLIPRVGEDPMDYNRCTWLSMPNVAIGEMISVFNTDNNPLFTATMFNATLQHEFAMRVEGGSVTNLYFDKLKNIEVSFPTKEEQEKIATYFDHLDHLITLHQHKCDELQNLKKYMLQNMFV